MKFFFAVPNTIILRLHILHCTLYILRSLLSSTVVTTESPKIAVQLQLKLGTEMCIFQRQMKVLTTSESQLPYASF